MKRHLAIMSTPTIEAILSGRKTIETRFSQHKIPPFGCVSVGDVIYMKPPGEEIKGQFRVKKVFYYEGLNQEDMEKIFKEFRSQISMGIKEEDGRYQAGKMNSRFGTLIFIGESERFITAPIKVKKKDLRGWMVLE